MGKGSAGYKGKSPRFFDLGFAGVYDINEVYDLSLRVEWPVPTNVFDLYYLVIGGGGGSGTTAEGKGGGGAGGMLTNYAGGLALNLEKSVSLNIVIGAGGAAGSNGSDSRFYGEDSDEAAFNITAIGGGHGDGGSGASGGGGSGGQTTANGGAGAQSGGSGTINQGNAGGDGSDGVKRNNNICNQLGGTGFYCDIVTTGGGGGGGGAGSAGTAGTRSGSTITPGPGGNGLASSITGTSVTYAGGAGGQGAADGTGAASYGGGNGQDGVVILRVPSYVTASNPGNDLTFTGVADGEFKVYTIIAGSGALVFN